MCKSLHSSKHKFRGSKKECSVNHTTGIYDHGASLSGSRGKRDVFRILFKPRKSITTRSNPTPNPPCGGAPYL